MKNYTFLMLFLAFSACTFAQNSPQTTMPSVAEPKKFDLQAGDLLFQDLDCGGFCDAIEKVTFGVNGAKFSHVAMAFRAENGEMKVLEAAGKGVVETPLADFLARSADDEKRPKVVVGRVSGEYQNLIPKAIIAAQALKGLPYDEVFDITNQKFYCSELLYEAFREANNGTPIFDLFPMTFLDPATQKTFPIWVDYFKELGVPIPEGKLGLNPGGVSRSLNVKIVYLYGKPSGWGMVEVK